MQAGCSLKAIEAAVASRQWAKAAQIVDMQDDAVARPYYRVIADHYAEVRDYALAQKYFLAAKNPRAAVDMYIKVGC
jgi:intraflagellar transport protein 172